MMPRTVRSNSEAAQRAREWRQTERGKKYVKEYNNRPEVKARRREYARANPGDNSNWILSDPWLSEEFELALSGNVIATRIIEDPWSLGDIAEAATKSKSRLAVFITEARKYNRDWDDCE